MANYFRNKNTGWILESLEESDSGGVRFCLVIHPEVSWDRRLQRVEYYDFDRGSDSAPFEILTPLEVLAWVAK